MDGSTSLAPETLPSIEETPEATSPRASSERDWAQLGSWPNSPPAAEDIASDWDDTAAAESAAPWEDADAAPQAASVALDAIWPNAEAAAESTSPEPDQMPEAAPVAASAPSWPASAAAWDVWEVT